MRAIRLSRTLTHAPRMPYPHPHPHHHSSLAHFSCSSGTPIIPTRHTVTAHTPIPDSVRELLQGYHISITLPVQWGDQDTFQHVNNVQYARYFESARIEAFSAIQSLAVQLKPNDQAQVDTINKSFKDFLSTRSVGPILKQLSIKYKFPITFPDTITIGTAMINGPDDSTSNQSTQSNCIQPDRFLLTHRLISHRYSVLSAECSSVIVSYDYRTRTKSFTPEIIQSALKEFAKLYHGQS